MSNEYIEIDPGKFNPGSLISKEGNGVSTIHIPRVKQKVVAVNMLKEGVDQLNQMIEDGWYITNLAMDSTGVIGRAMVVLQKEV